MLTVALTGGIATGKSYVLNRLRRLGVPCLDADELAHGVLAPETEASRAVAERFGPDVMGPDGVVDRGALGRIVFADANARRDLEAIVHPAVRRAISAGLQAFARTENPLFAVVDIPLLHETGRVGDFDRVIATVCLPAMQRERLRQRGLTDEDAQRRLDAQLSADGKTAGAHWVIRTDGSFAETDRQIDDVYRELTMLPRQ